MKKVLVVLAMATFVFALPSCKKCSTCQYTFEDGFGDPQTTSLTEFCGKKKEVTSYEDACKASAAIVAGSCTCTKS